MYCYLENWCHKKRKVEIPDGTKEIAGVIISGDEILVYPLFVIRRHTTGQGNSLMGHSAGYGKMGNGSTRLTIRSLI